MAALGIFVFGRTKKREEFTTEDTESTEKREIEKKKRLSGFGS